MPKVNRSDLMPVVRALYRADGGDEDDAAKLALAELLIEEAWVRKNKCGGGW
jgi:hypothetical protein